MGTSRGHTHLLSKYYVLDYTLHGILVKAVTLIQTQLQSMLNDEPWEGYLTSQIHRDACKMKLRPFLACKDHYCDKIK